jgi:hypothetical protein
MLDKYNPEEALLMCKKQCSKTNLVNQCIENCDVDYHAIERYETKQNNNIPVSKPLYNTNSKPNPKSNPVNKAVGDISARLILGVVLIIIFIIILLIFFLIYKYRK